MLLERFPVLEFPLTADELSLLPRNSAFRYRLAADGRGVLRSPPPALRTCLLNFGGLPAAADALPGCESGLLIPLSIADWPPLQEVYHAAFGQTLPWSVLSATAARDLTRDCLQWVQAGGDGWLIDQACLGWFEGSRQSVGDRGELRAAALVTLNPAGPLEDFSAAAWHDPIPDDPLRVRWGRPHLHAICVDPRWQRQGLATALLREVIATLQQLGYSELSSTVLVDNAPSLMWHWRGGFRPAGPVRAASVTGG